jgi:chromosome segregation ATPase
MSWYAHIKYVFDFIQVQLAEARAENERLRQECSQTKHQLTEIEEAQQSLILALSEKDKELETVRQNNSYSQFNQSEGQSVQESVDVLRFNYENQIEDLQIELTSLRNQLRNEENKVNPDCELDEANQKNCELSVECDHLRMEAAKLQSAFTASEEVLRKRSEEFDANTRDLKNIIDSATANEEQSKQELLQFWDHLYQILSGSLSNEIELPSEFKVCSILHIFFTLT